MRFFHLKSIMTALVIMAIGTVCCVGAAADDAKRHVLVLHSYHQGLQWTDNISAGIKQELGRFSGEVDIHFEYLNTKRIPGEEYIYQLIRFESHKTRLDNIDFSVIISSDNTALRFIVENGDTLYPGVPVVFCGVNNFEPEMLGGNKNITGVVEAVDLASTLSLMTMLHPRRKKVFVILDKTPTGEAIKKEFDRVAARFSKQFDFEFFRDFILSEVPGKIKNLGKKDLIYLLTFNRDRNGTFISYVDGIRMIRKASDVPIYGSWDFYLGKGIVGGMITSGVAQGRQAAKMASQILNGTPAAAIPVVTKSPNQYMFDYNELKRFNIKLSNLPKTSRIINLPPSFLDRYKRWFAGALGIIIIIALLLIWRLHIQKKRQLALIESNIELDRRVADQTEILEMQNRKLEKEIKERIEIEKDLVQKKDDLEEALSKVKTLSGLLPICSHCKKIRDDKGYWNQIESYINEHSDAIFTHGICPGCAEKLYPYLTKKDEEKTDNS